VLRVSLSKVSRRIAYAVEPFGFECVQGELPPPLLEGNRDSMGKQPSLFEKASGRLADKLQYMHIQRLFWPLSDRITITASQ
jgi:hypothetical protein